jgi:hypothetical protein
LPYRYCKELHVAARNEQTTNLVCGIAVFVCRSPNSRCEYAYGRRAGQQALYEHAKRQGWIVISMKGDWKKVFAFD